MAGLLFLISFASPKTVIISREGNRSPIKMGSFFFTLLLMLEAKAPQGMKINQEPFTNEKQLGFGFVVLCFVLERTIKV